MSAYHITTTDKRSLLGTIKARSGSTITIQLLDGEQITLSIDQVKVMEAQKISIMPERLLDDLPDQQIRDLVAYMMKINMLFNPDDRLLQSINCVYLIEINDNQNPSSLLLTVMRMKKILLSTGCLLSMVLVNAQSPAFEWARSMGGASPDHMASMAVDASGNVYYRVILLDQ